MRASFASCSCHFDDRQLYRVLYRRSGNLIALLHMFRKDTVAGSPSVRSTIARAAFD